MYFNNLRKITRATLLWYLQVRPGTIGGFCSEVGNNSGHFNLYFKNLRHITHSCSLAILSSGISIGGLRSVVRDNSGHIKNLRNITHTSLLAIFSSVICCTGTIGGLCLLVGDISGHIYLHFRILRFITQPCLFALSFGICSSRYDRLVMLCGWGHFWSY